MSASRRHLPLRSNEYRCSICRGIHIYGSQTGRECGRTQGARLTSAVPVSPRKAWKAAGSARGNWSQTGEQHRPPPPPPPSRRQARRERARTTISSARRDIDEALLAYLFDRDGFYEKLADRLLDRVPLRRKVRRGHWLCQLLNTVASTADPGTYSELLGRSTADGFATLGAPPFMAEVLGAGAGLGLKVVMGHTPVAQVSNAVRVLVPMVCPDLAGCPCERDVIKVLATPALAAELKHAAGGG